MCFLFVLIPVMNRIGKGIFRADPISLSLAVDSFKIPISMAFLLFGCKDKADGAKPVLPTSSGQMG